jgi:hypothetical protein
VTEEDSWFDADEIRPLKSAELGPGEVEEIDLTYSDLPPFEFKAAEISRLSLRNLVTRASLILSRQAIVRPTQTFLVLISRV